MPPSRVDQMVRARGRHRCEYCGLPQFTSRLTFPIDHVIARQHRGPDTAENLAVACGLCNAKKGPNLTGLDPIGGGITRLYHPRQDRWPDHFAWSAVEIVGLSAGPRSPSWR